MQCAKQYITHPYAIRYTIPYNIEHTSGVVHIYTWFFNIMIISNVTSHTRNQPLYHTPSIQHAYLFRPCNTTHTTYHAAHNAIYHPISNIYIHWKVKCRQHERIYYIHHYMTHVLDLWPMRVTSSIYDRYMSSIYDRCIFQPYVWPEIRTCYACAYWARRRFSISRSYQNVSHKLHIRASIMTLGFNERIRDNLRQNQTISNNFKQYQTILRTLKRVAREKSR